LAQLIQTAILLRYILHISKRKALLFPQRPAGTLR